MVRMRLFVLIIFSIVATYTQGQDKIYLNDNSLAEGKIIQSDDHSVKILLTDQTTEIISRKNIAVIIYDDGTPEVIPVTSEEKEKTALPEWMTGINILQPVSGIGGFMIEKNITRHYSVRVSQAFLISRYYSYESSTSLLNNFYFGKGRVKLINSFGLNVIYSETQTSLYDNQLILAANYNGDYIMPYPQNGFSSYVHIDFTFGTGIYVDLTRHLAFTTQVNLASHIYQNTPVFELDLNNSGFSFFYKF